MIRRDLVAVDPDAFRSDLAAVLSILSRRFSELCRQEEALAAIEEAVTTLRGPFIAQPMAFGQQMASILSDYLERCKDARREESDPALCGPILETFERLKDQSIE